ncbi:hypothetical protein FJZ21_02460 [Candidatus Pacearchaeota archaeon]|nr:hypothetical protein [Candidatus Pacearchaeota archaeon]
MNSRGFDIAITTIILIIISLAVLIGLIFFVKNGFRSFQSTTDPLLKTQSLEGARQACELVCKTENEITFCCESITMDKEDLFCTNSTLGVNCNIDCSIVSCT